jgi:hypothetical protein
MKENKNEPAYPEICDTRNIPLFESSGGLTKLELISAMCLQGILSYPFRQNEPYENTFERVSSAIEYAKELLKQLEAEND